MNSKELNGFYRGCRTYRRFTQEPVAAATLAQMVENARIASSAMNQQQVRLVVLSDKEMVEGMHPFLHYAGSLPKELGTPVEGELPTAFVLLLADPKAPAPWIDIDLGIVVETLASSAWADGYGSCILGAIERQGICELLDGKADRFFEEPLQPEQIRLVLALGRPDHESHLVEGPTAAGDLKYYLDEERNYYVPKRKTEDMALFL